MKPPVITPAVDGNPGSHPHSNRPNWQAGDDDADELLHQKIADAQRAGSERQLAKPVGLSRTHPFHLLAAERMARETDATAINP